MKFSLVDIEEYILFVGRINHIKGPDIILKAFFVISERHPFLHLIFAGPNDGMIDELLISIRKRNISSRIHFLGHVEGEDRVAAYKGAKFLVVPSRSEAMSIVALEAGICGKLALITDQCGFTEIRQISPDLEVEASVRSIKQGILNLLKKTDNQQKLAENYEKFVIENYSWNSLVFKYQNLYSSVIISNLKNN